MSTVMTLVLFSFFLEMLWVAPELLPLTLTPGIPATQKGDVYSFGIILEEIIVRGGPYEAAKQFLEPHGKVIFVICLSAAHLQLH